jgi:cysteinyl-tRNA synthetase
MADYTYDELKRKTAAELKEIAGGIEHEAVKGYTQMNKAHLIEAICKALNLDMHVHHEVKGVDKSSIKKRIKALKVERDKAIENKDPKELKNVRRQIKKLKNTLRRAMV